MTNWILRWVVSGIALAIVAHLNIGVSYSTLEALALATVVIGLVNATIRPVLMLLTLPINCLTFGMLGTIINAGLFFGVGRLVHGFHVEGFLGAALGPVLMGLVGGVLSAFLPDPSRKEK